MARAYSAGGGAYSTMAPGAAAADGSEGDDYGDEGCEAEDALAGAEPAGAGELAGVVCACANAGNIVVARQAATRHRKTNRNWFMGATSEPDYCRNRIGM